MPDSYGDGAYGDATYGTPSMVEGAVREKPPLDIEYEVTVPTGRKVRWAPDEVNPGNVPSGESFSSVAPGGFDTLDLTLPRRADLDLGGTNLLSTIRAMGVGGEVFYEGRINGVPDVSGDQMAITPQAEGWKEHFADDTSAAEIFADIDMAGWGGPSVQRRIVFDSADYVISDGSVIPDETTAAPVLELGYDGPWEATSRPATEAWYDAQNAPLGSLYYAGNKNARVDAGDSNFSWSAALSTDDIGTTEDVSGELRTASPFADTLSATAADRVFARISHSYDFGPQGGDNQHYAIFWTVLAVYGNHGLPTYGTESATSAKGVLASDVIAYAVRKWASKVAIADADGFVPTGFVIPHLVFKDKATVADMISGANRFHLRHWFVWEGPSLYYHDIGLGPNTKRWRARVGPAKLQETGSALTRLWNGVIVRYTDVTGVTRTVGPTGSGANVTDDTLADTDEDNSANQIGIRKWATLDMGGVSTPAGAIQVGRRFLSQTQQLDTSGQATLVGHVQDDAGVWHSYAKVRAGDQISFVDAKDTSYRNIVGAHADVSGRSVSIDLDAPPEALAALLERLQVVLVGRL